MKPRLHGLICVALVGLTSICLGRVLGNDFVNIDDPHYVTANSWVCSGLNWPSVCWAWTTSHAGFWIPLTWMSLELDATLCWPRAWGFHLTNLLLHIINTLLVYRLMVKLRMADGGWRIMNSEAGVRGTGFLAPPADVSRDNRVDAPRPQMDGLGSPSHNSAWAAVIAALFAIHPLRVESVAWVTERKDVLSCCFGLLALLAYLHYREKPGIWRMLLVCLLFAMSLLAKPVLVTLPAIMLLLDWWRIRGAGCQPAARQAGWQPAPRIEPAAQARGAAKTLACAVLEKLPLFGLSLLCTWITIQTQNSAGATALVELPLPWRLANAAVSYESYLAKTFWPVNLAVFYPHPRDSLTGLQIGIACLVLIGVTLLVSGVRKQVPAMLVGWLWFIIALAPNIGLIQAGAQGMADRFTYFALLGLFLAVVCGADYLAGRLRIATGARIATAIVVLAILGALTWVQVGLWKNCATLYEHALNVTTDNADIHRYLGIYYFEQGDSARAEQQLADALAVSEKLGAKASFDVYLYYGAVLHKKMDWRPAIEKLEKAVELNPQEATGRYLLADSLLHLAMMLDAQGRRVQARQAVQRAVSMVADPRQRSALEEYLRGIE